MKWITRERFKVDRVACPWLIKKFVDPEAEFVFLPHDPGEGLRWIAHGFSTLGLSGHEILEREFLVYNALYSECRERAAA